MCVCICISVANTPRRFDKGKVQDIRLYSVSEGFQKGFMAL